MKAIHLFSGGLDSTTLLWELLRGEYVQCHVECLCFDYGQRHRIEIQRAKELAKLADVPLHIVELPRIYERCALVGYKSIPTGIEPTDPAQSATIVPNRNMILIAIAAAYALEHGGTFVSWGANADDAAIFPDCRGEFLKAINEALRICDNRRMEVHAPYIMANRGKRWIANRAKELGVPINRTWSCYNPQFNEPCHECGACKTREAALVYNACSGTGIIGDQNGVDVGVTCPECQ